MIRKLGLVIVLLANPALAHDPIFGLGPHVLFQGGVEVAPEMHLSKKGAEQEIELGLELVYGITGDWAAGLELPYAGKQDGSGSANGAGDVKVFTKYRFWHHDTLGTQEAMGVFLGAKLNTGSTSTTPALGTGTTDSILGLAYGYESRKWYRFAAVRYRQNGRNSTGLKRGDKWLIDLVGGIRPKLTGYREPDTVWFLEFNGEYGQQADSSGTPVPNTGGTEWFLSPGIFWTKRNFAIKAGVQIPIYSVLNGTQDKTDYRAKLVTEWHL